MRVAEYSPATLSSAPPEAMAAATRGRAAIDQLSTVCDPGTLRLLETTDASPGGAVAARGRVQGRPVVCYAQRADYLGGSVGVQEAAVIVDALRTARETRVPLISFVASAGARLQEGATALAGFARIFRENVRLSGLVPQISVITGPSAGGGCYSPALTDFTVMTQRAVMFLTGPRVVREALGEEIGLDELGSARVHQRNGVCHFVARDEIDAATLVRHLLRFLPQHAGARARNPPRDGLGGDPRAVVPQSPRQVYDVREVIAQVVDAGILLESARHWGRSLVTGFACLDGTSVGVVANQPRHLGGAIDVEASQKGASFVGLCDRFGIPLLVLVDTPGFVPGTRQETAGIIRHGAGFLRAFAAATAPRVTLVLRKAYGGAYITMNSKDLGADRVLAWPDAEIGIMGAHAAVNILHRRDLASSPQPDSLAARLAADYAADHLSAAAALSRGIIDGVIAPHLTRQRLIEALADAHLDEPSSTP